MGTAENPTSPRCQADDEESRPKRSSVRVILSNMGYKAPVGPRRSSSPRSSVRPPRAATVVALLAFAAGVVSDSLGGDFWERHGLIAGMTGSFIVVLLSVGIVNETIARRARSRWRLLAQ